jgi:uncharacterized protein YdeI (YjbR/CyaY-like superfamily)
VGLADYEQILFTDRASWRAWLARNAATSPGIWLVTYKKATGEPAPSYDDVVEEALCFGWIDSTVRPRDERTAMQLLTPRKPGSTWAASNKARLERLIPAGLMDPRGLAVVEAAKADGSWSSLDSVEAMEVPADLAAALGADQAADEFFAALPPFSLKQHLWWVISAKRPETRSRRITAIVTAAREGRRAV